MFSIVRCSWSVVVSSGMVNVPDMSVQSVVRAIDGPTLANPPWVDSWPVAVRRCTCNRTSPPRTSWHLTQADSKYDFPGWTGTS